MGRSALRLRRAEGRREGDGSRDHRVLPRSYVRLQDAKGRGVRRHSEDVNGQDPEVPLAQPGGFGEGVFGLIVVPGWCISTRPQMRDCASGKFEIRGSMLRIAPE